MLSDAATLEVVEYLRELTLPPLVRADLEGMLGHSLARTFGSIPCFECEVVFARVRSDQKFCSAKCRTKNANRNKYMPVSRKKRHYGKGHKRK